MKSFQLWLAILLIGTLFGCNDCPTTRPVGFASRPSAKAVDKPGHFLVSSSCNDDEQLLSGGFTFDEPVLRFDSHGIRIPHQDENSLSSVITVAGSYPTGDKKSWTVDFVNPDLGPAGPNMGRFVMVIAYCLPTAVMDLGMDSRMNSEPDPQNNVVNRLDIRAPQGAVVTGGGYRMQYQEGDPLPGYNGYVLESAPLIEGDAATGWQVGKMPSLRAGLTAKMNGYVLFATKNLSAAKIQRVPAGTDGTGYGFYAATPQCREGEFSAGGGFEMLGSPDQAFQIPHHINENIDFPDASGWRVLAFDGFQAGASGGGLGTPTNASVYGSAVCLKAPRPSICIKIKTPPNGTFIDLESADPARKSEPLKFSAEAFSGSTQLPASAISWTVNGATLGTGSPATFALPVPYPVPASVNYYFQEFHITATATDGTANASSSITVYVVRKAVL